MAGFQSGDVGVVLVGDEHLEAVPIGVGEGHLVAGARMGPLAAADRPGALWTARRVQLRQLADPGAGAAAVGVGVDRNAATPQGSAAICPTTRHAVGVEQTRPNSPPAPAGWPGRSRSRPRRRAAPPGRAAPRHGHGRGCHPGGQGPGWRGGQARWWAEPVGQQHHPGVAAKAVGVGGDVEAGAGADSLHRWGDPPGWGMGPSSSRILPGREGSLLPDTRLRSAHTKYRGEGEVRWEQHTSASLFKAPVTV